MGKVDTPVCHVGPDLWRGPRRRGTRGGGGRAARSEATCGGACERSGALRARHARPQLLDRRGLVASQVSSQTLSSRDAVEAKGKVQRRVGVRI